MSIFIISISTIIHAKYIFYNEFYIANLNIDRTKPKIELVNITNNNTGYESYANKTHTITIKVKVADKNLKDNYGKTATDYARELGYGNIIKMLENQ